MVSTIGDPIATTSTSSSLQASPQTSLVASWFYSNHSTNKATSYTTKLESYTREQLTLVTTNKANKLI